MKMIGVKLNGPRMVIQSNCDGKVMDRKEPALEKEFF